MKLGEIYLGDSCPSLQAGIHFPGPPVPTPQTRPGEREVAVNLQESDALTLTRPKQNASTSMIRTPTPNLDSNFAQVWTSLDRQMSQRFDLHYRKKQKATSFFLWSL